MHLTYHTTALLPDSCGPMADGRFRDSKGRSAGLGHETMVCAVCLSMFLRNKFRLSSLKKAASLLQMGNSCGLPRLFYVYQ